MSSSEEEYSSTKQSPNFSDVNSKKTAEPVPKRSLERIVSSASIDSNGELYFARSSSSASINSRKLSCSNSSFEESLRERRESMGLQSLHPVEASKEAALPATIDTTQQRRKIGVSRVKLPQANQIVRPGYPIQEGRIEEISGEIMNEGIQMQDLSPEHLFTDSRENDDNNIADSVVERNYLELTQILSKPTLVSQPSDASSVSNGRKTANTKVVTTKVLPINPQNLNEIDEIHSEKSYQDTKEKMIISDLPFFSCVRIVSIFVSFSDDIKTTKATTYVPGTQAFVTNGQKNTFESDPFDIVSETKQLKYKGKIITIISPECLSIGFAPLKGKNDKKFSWPFNMMLLFKVVNIDDRKSIIRGFRCDVNGSKFSQCLSRPSECNMAIGFAHFMSTASLSNGFIENDTLKIIARLSPKKYVPHSEVKLELPSIVRT